MALTEPSRPDTSRPDPLLERAAQELRDDDDGSWLSVSAAVLDRVRATARRTRSLDASYPDEAATEDSLRVSDTIVMLQAARALARTPCEIRRLDLVVVERHRCSGVHLDVAAHYGHDFGDLAAELAGRTASAVNAVLGHVIESGDVRVHIADVVAPDEGLGLQSS